MFDLAERYPSCATKLMRLSERRSDGKIPRLMESGICKTPYLRMAKQPRSDRTTMGSSAAVR
eukprot:scaffold188892_cov31-Attheya_sp.AAC.1